MRQMRWDETHRGEIWRQIVLLKIKMQENLLRRLGLNYDSGKWEKYLAALETNDRSNREGQAARLYFNTLFGKQFQRRDGSPTNGALNYGYAILCSAMTRALSIHGYHPSIGIAHRGATNPFKFSYDLMEPFRPWVDAIVWNQKGKPLDRDFKKELIGVTEQKVLYSKKRMTLDSAMDRFVLNITFALRTNTLFRGELEFDHA